jgi:hypothetical protein
VEELLAPTLLPLSVASTLREVADSPDTSSTLPSLTPFIILAKANVVMKLSCSSCCLRVCLRGELIQGSKGCCGYLWREIPTSTSLHAPMPLPIKEGDERCWVGVRRSQVSAAP